MPPDSIEIRPWSDSDSIDELTSLLHAAYAIWKERDVRFFATHQTPADTLDRISCGQCFVAVFEGRLVGTITIYREGYSSPDVSYRHPNLWVFGQFGVLPEFKGAGLGTRLLRHVEDFAAANGAEVMACDTAEPAVELVAYYQRMGYAIVDRTSWDVTNYESLILAKSLDKK